MNPPPPPAHSASIQTHPAHPQANPTQPQTNPAQPQTNPLQQDQPIRIQVIIDKVPPEPTAPATQALTHVSDHLNHVEVIKVKMVKTVEQLMKDAFTAWWTNDREHEHAAEIELVNPGPAKSKKKKFAKAVVEWEATRTRQPVTEIHDWNVEAILERLRAREMCDDIVWLLF